MKIVSKIAAMLLVLCLAVPVSAQEPVKIQTEVMTRNGIAFTWQERMKDGEKGPNTNPVIVFDIVSAWQNAKKGREPAVANCDKFQITLHGAIWCFVNAANLKKFADKTDKDGKNPFIPFVGGRCTLAVALGMLEIYGDPRTARIVRGDFGDLLVLHGNKKWWPLFNKKRSIWLAVATSNWNMARSPVRILANDKLPK